MAEICSQSYMDSEFLGGGNQKVSNSVLLHVEESGPYSGKVPVRVFPWTKVFEFKKQIAALPSFEHLPSSEMRLFVKNIELNQENKTILDYGLANDSLIIVQTRRTIASSQQGTINPYRLFDKPQRKVIKLLRMSSHALHTGCVPTLTKEGTSGAYLIENQKGKKISIFKPFDEEVNAPNNPRNMAGELGSDAICKGILSGECATREVAAYLLDSYGGSFHSVPTTTYVEFYHPIFEQQNLVPSSPIVSAQEELLNLHDTKHGSLQEFVNSVGMASDFGSSRFSDSEIHKIGILDIRILNCDRNDANMLVQQDEGSDIIKLIPIDHGLSLPDNLEIYEDSIAWMNFPQAKRPFTQEQLAYIREINPIKDAQMLSQKLGFRPICLRNFRVAETFLKQAAQIGFTLYEIGKMIYRTEDYEEDTPKTKRSELEKVVLQAENLYLNMIENQKQNMNVITEFSEEDDSEGSGEHTNQSPKVLKLKKKVSLPTLKKKNTSFHERRHEARKEREGINGVSKTVWNKYSQDEWSELFYHYFEDLMETFLNEKMKKSKSK